MVPERDRKEVYDDVLFFLAKKEKVMDSRWLDSPALSFLWTCHSFLYSVSLLLNWKLVWNFALSQ